MQVLNNVVRRGLVALPLTLAACGLNNTTQPGDGSLTTSVTGLPSGVNAAVTVTGPDGFQTTVVATETLTGLQAGSYTITAAEVLDGDHRYAAGAGSQTVQVVSGSSPASVSILYELASGLLALEIGGLPSGGNGAVVVTGPNGYNTTVTESDTIGGLSSGTYTLTANDATVDGDVYGGTPSTQTVSITASLTPVEAAVSYTMVSGALRIAVSGLPPGADADITVTGPGAFSQLVRRTDTLRGLTPGTYSITARQIGHDGLAYDPADPDQTADVVAAETASVAVVYSVSGPFSLNLTIDGMYAVQSVQRYDGTVPLVAGRDALLRVFATANMPNTEIPRVRVRLYDGGTLVETHFLDAQTVGVPTSPNEGSLTSTWNLLIPASRIAVGLSILADVDPDNTVFEMDETDNQFPATGQPQDADVRTLAPLAIRFVPVFQTATSDTGNVSVTNTDQFLDQVTDVFPAASYDIDVREVYTTSAPELQSDDGNGAWGMILSEIRTLRNVTDGSAKYYYGVVRTGYSSGVAGVGYVPSSPSSTSKAALGWDFLPSGSGVMAHELGHNFGRHHAPCGNPSGVDQSYPYSDASIGRYGMDVAENDVKSPSNTKDLMSYCAPDWISDYTYEAVLDFRAASPTGQPMASTGTAQSGLLVWGRITQDSIVLEPAFRVTARPAPPEGAGAYRLEATATDGSTIFAYPFAPDEVADLPRGREEHFSFVIPAAASRLDRIDNLRVAGPGRETVRVAPAGRSTPVVTAVREGQDAVRLRWDRTEHPMVMVRDPRTGTVLAFARGGDATVWTATEQLQLSISHGVGSSTVMTTARRSP